MTKRRRSDFKDYDPEPVAANGLLNRRVFLEVHRSCRRRWGIGGRGRAVDRPAMVEAARGAVRSLYPAVAFRRQGGSRHSHAAEPGHSRHWYGAHAAASAGWNDHADGLHFERHHYGVPDIDPDQHRLVIHGMVKRPLIFTLEALSRYPMAFAHRLRRMRRQQPALNTTQAQPLDVPAIHGLLSCANGPACRCRCCSTKPASSRGATGCSPKAPTPPR